MIRSAAAHDWPALKNAAAPIAAIARSGSASSRTMIGPLPPSSITSSLPDASRADGGADGARPGEPDDDDALVLDERRRHLDGRSGQQAEQALGNARFDDALGEQRGDARGRRRRLEDDRVAAGQRRPDVFDRDVHREVPGRDRDDDAARLAERHHPLARVLDRDRLAGQPSRLGGGEPEAAGRRGDLAERLGQRLAVLEDEVGGDLVAAAHR